MCFSESETNQIMKEKLNNSIDEQSSTDEEERWREPKRKPDDIPNEYWSLIKLIKYVKIGNSIATNLCLCIIRDFDLSLQILQRAIQTSGGLEVLVNLTLSNDLVSRMNALIILKQLTENIDIRRYVIDLNLINSLVELLLLPALDVKAVATLTLANLAKVRLARKLIRERNALPTLVSMMDTNIEFFNRPKDFLSLNESDQVSMSMAGSRAMSVLLASRRNCDIAEKRGIIKIIGCLLSCTNDDVILSILQCCRWLSYRETFQLAVDTEQMIPNFVRLLKSENVEILIARVSNNNRMHRSSIAGENYVRQWCNAITNRCSAK